MKRIIIAAVAVFVAWSVMDFVIHGVILRSSYEATKEMWRPENEIKMGLLHVVGLISAIVFAFLYGCFVGKKSVATGAKFGLLFGLGVGVSMAYGTYAVMPIPYNLALTWFLGTVAEAVVAGLLVGAIIKE